MTTTTTTTQPRMHQSWCEHHKEDGNLGFCCTKATEVGGYLVELSDGTLDSEPAVFLLDPGIEGICLTLDRARAFAAAILDLCDRAEGQR